MPKPLSVQLYSLRKDAEANGCESVFKALSNIGYQHVETAGLYNKTAVEIKQSLDNHGLKVSAAHMPLLDATKHEQSAKDAQTLGCRHVVSSIPKGEWETEEKIRVIAQKFNDAINFFGPKGLQVSMHNHEWEYSDTKKRDLLLELCPKLTLEIDVYWAKVGGADPVELIKRYANRTPLLHIKDGPADPKDRNKPMTAVGQGTVDVASCIRAAEGTGVEFLAVELDFCATSMEQAIRDSYNFLTQRSLAVGSR
jgi:sugar phosphate isomerase/epimerase